MMATLKEKRAKLRRRLPGLEVEDYTFLDAAREKVTLSSLFGERDELIAIHNMGRACPNFTCSSGGSGETSTNAARSSTSRGWTFRMLFARGTSFAKDLGFQAKDGGYKPGASVFQKQKDGTIVRVSRARFGPGDDYCSVWHLFDLLPRGRARWEPKFKY